MWWQPVVVLYLSVVTRCDKISKRDVLQKKTDNLLSRLYEFETILPELVTKDGHFLSFDIRHSSALHHTKKAHTRSKRWTRYQQPNLAQNPHLYMNGKDQVGRYSIYYKLSAYGREFHLNLSLNTQLMSKDFAVEMWDKRGRTFTSNEIWDCHYVGTSVEPGVSNAAISNCNGLYGVFSTDTDDYFVEPLWNHTNVIGVEGYPHVVYSRSSLKLGDISSHCGVTDRKRRKYAKLYQKRPGSVNGVLKPRHQFPLWRWRPKGKNMLWRYRMKRVKSKRRQRRSVSLERHVETLVVIDKKMKDYHMAGESSGLNALSAYVLTVMNIVAKLFHNPTIGNAINIVVTKMIVLENDKGKNLPEINFHADKSLDSFCKWQQQLQKKINGSVMNHQHDNAILMTRYDICSYKNKPCGTLGLAPVEGMCEKDRSCSINQDIGLASAFTIAHEIGHNFGMHHDGAGNQCGMPGKEPARLMAARLTKNTSPFHWSSCSRKYVSDFLE